MSLGIAELLSDPGTMSSAESEAILEALSTRCTAPLEQRVSRSEWAQAVPAPSGQRTRLWWCLSHQPYLEMDYETSQEMSMAAMKEQEERCVAVRKEKGVQLHHASSLLNLALDKPPGKARLLRFYNDVPMDRRDGTIMARSEM
ncbi:unnamed protein product [Cladocopium goreaui]|uniref:Uncharacterized protein n=1 Tax=Cladocopium goreaui TaxID=2562237 RepID=A0A9P1M3L9_9DINO|nr:unnamed protein product [Cladocopium goreaui]